MGKIFTNDIHFATFAKVFPCQNFTLYGMKVEARIFSALSVKTPTYHAYVNEIS